MILKVCGMQEGDNIRRVEQLGVDMLGFIFYPRSPRFVTAVPEYLPQHAKRVGVFVNEAEETVRTYASRFSLDYIQLHGNESEEYCKSLREKGFKLIKAFSIADANDLKNADDYSYLCDYLLFDTKTAAHGGSGKQFDWGLLSGYQGETPFLLSGGINIHSVESLREFTHPRLIGYDINSCFEIKAGVKNVALIQQFINQLKE